MTDRNSLYKNAEGFEIWSADGSTPFRFILKDQLLMTAFSSKLKRGCANRLAGHTLDLQSLQASLKGLGQTLGCSRLDFQIKLAGQAWVTRKAEILLAETGLAPLCVACTDDNILEAFFFAGSGRLRIRALKEIITERSLYAA